MCHQRGKGTEHRPEPVCNRSRLLHPACMRLSQHAASGMRTPMPESWARWMALMVALKHSACYLTPRLPPAAGPRCCRRHRSLQHAAATAPHLKGHQRRADACKIEASNEAGQCSSKRMAQTFTSMHAGCAAHHTTAAGCCSTAAVTAASAAAARRRCTSRCNSSALMSAGLTPPMRLACPMSRGRTCRERGWGGGCWHTTNGIRCSRAPAPRGHMCSQWGWPHAVHSCS